MDDPEPGLLQALLDDPDDDGVRLVYAVLERIPGLYVVRLNDCEVTEAGLALVAGLRHLQSLQCCPG